MRRFGAVLLTGLLGGALCGFLIVLVLFYVSPPTSVAQTTPTRFLVALEAAALYGPLYGASFGLISFPTCYYLFLRETPLKLSLAVTIPATVVAGWLGLLILLYVNFGECSVDCDWKEPIVSTVVTYGPGFVGLLLSSLGLYLWSRRTKRSSSSAA